MLLKKIQIIGYIHVCQKGEWQRSFHMLLDSIKVHGLYAQSKEIRLGIVNDVGKVIEDTILNDPLFKIIYIGESKEYERPTLLHMRKQAESDSADTLYFYLHTKGIRHFGTSNEQCVIDWIQLMLYWNIEKWNLALVNLEKYDTYGCNFHRNHYSGNFWWAKRSHILSLPTTIGSRYTDPELWILLKRQKSYSIYNSGLQGLGHYTKQFPRHKYAK